MTSLSAVVIQFSRFQLVSRAQRAGLPIVARDVFAHPTLRPLAEHASSASAPITKLSAVEAALNPLQEGMVFHSLYAPGTPVHVSQLSL